MIREQSINNDKRLRIDYFFKKWLKLNIKFPTILFHGKIKTKKQYLKVDSLKDYKKIITTYLDVYFQDLYQNKNQYFPLSGDIQLAKASYSQINSKRKVVNKNRAIGWIWYNRPNIAFCSNIIMIKIKGSGRKVQALDNSFREENDVEELPSVNGFRKKLIENNKVFKVCLVE